MTRCHSILYSLSSCACCAWAMQRAATLACVPSSPRSPARLLRYDTSYYIAKRRRVDPISATTNVRPEQTFHLNIIPLLDGKLAPFISFIEGFQCAEYFPRPFVLSRMVSLPCFSRAKFMCRSSVCLLCCRAPLSAAAAAASILYIYS